MSHEAILWAVKSTDVPLDERMMLVYLADFHCPDNGCWVSRERLAKEAMIGVADVDYFLDRLERRAKISFVGGGRFLLAFEPGFTPFVGRAR